VGLWVPRLVPALSTALFHGAIRAAHAVRAIEAADTSARRAELARALGYWAARFRPGEAVAGVHEVDDVVGTVTRAAAEAARYYIAAPSIYFLHGVTGAMAVELLAKHLNGTAQATALAQVEAEHRALYAGARPVARFQVAGVPEAELVREAERSGDPHEVKLVEAALRGLSLSADPVFVAAAETVTGFASDGAA